MPFDTSRMIFEYQVGGVTRYADPSAVRRELERASMWDFEAICRAAAAQADAVTPDASLAREDTREKLYRIVCAGFGLTPFDPSTGQGVTEAEAAVVLSAFHAWLDAPPVATE